MGLSPETLWMLVAEMSHQVEDFEIRSPNCTRKIKVVGTFPTSLVVYFIFIFYGRIQSKPSPSRGTLNMFKNKQVSPNRKLSQQTLK